MFRLPGRVARTGVRDRIARSGEEVKLTLSTASNVLLLDTVEYAEVANFRGIAEGGKTFVVVAPPHRD